MSKRVLAPILVSVYHRLDCLKRCVESLLSNPEAQESEIWIVSDAAFKPEHEQLIQEVREYILSIRGFKAVHPVFHEKNMGAGHSVIPVYNELLNGYEHSKGFIEAIVESLAERQLPFIAAPIRYAFPDEEFADTNYHLNGRGVPRRVRYIAEDLKPKILASLNK